MSGVFSDYKITILNELSKQWSQYQHSWQSEVTDILKSIILTELEDYSHDIYDYKWVKSSMTKGLPFLMCGVNNDTSINILDSMKSLIF